MGRVGWALITFLLWCTYYIFSLPALYTWGGGSTVEWVGLITSLLLHTDYNLIQLPATLRYHLVDARSQELLSTSCYAMLLCLVLLIQLGNATFPNWKVGK